MTNNGVTQYGDTFLEGVVHNQKKTDERLASAIHRAQGFGESRDVIRGMMLALKIIRGDAYDQKMMDLGKK